MAHVAIVYLLTNTANGKRYVGKTKRSLAKRWRRHLQDAAKGIRRPLYWAIRKYGAASFRLEVLGEYGTEAEALSAEREWIAKLGTMGDGGYNCCEGGRGCLGYRFSPEQVAKKADSARAQWRNPEIAARNRSAIEAARTPEVWARIRATQAKVRSTPVFRSKMSASTKSRWSDPEQRAHMTLAIRAAKAKPEYKARASSIAKSGVTAESRAKQSAAARAQWSDPVEKARRVEAIRATRTPEMIETIRVRHAANFKTPEMQTKLRAAARQRCHGPEGAARRAAQKARPCRKCGGRRVQLANGKMRCRPCHAAREREKRAVIAA